MVCLRVCLLIKQLSYKNINIAPAYLLFKRFIYFFHPSTHTKPTRNVILNWLRTETFSKLLSWGTIRIISPNFKALPVSSKPKVHIACNTFDQHSEKVCAKLYVCGYYIILCRVTKLVTRRGMRPTSLQTLGLPDASAFTRRDQTIYHSILLYVCSIHISFGMTAILYFSVEE